MVWWLNCGMSDCPLVAVWTVILLDKIFFFQYKLCLVSYFVNVVSNFPVLAKTKFFEGCSQYFWSSQIMAKFTSRKHRSQGWVNQLQNYESFIFMAAIIITYWEFKGTNPQYHHHHYHNHHYHYHRLCCSRRKAIKR